MKKLIKATIIIILAVLISCGGYLSVRAIRVSYWTKVPLSLPTGFTVTAHTGCCGTADNSLEAIQCGIDNGADIVEIDLRYLGRVPVLAHDEKHTTDAVTFESAMALVAANENIGVNIDVKDTEHLEEINEIIESYNLLDRVFFTGITFLDVDAVKSMCPNIPYMINETITKKQSRDRDYLDSLADRIYESGAFGLNMNYKNLTEEIIQAMRHRGLQVSVWTVNSNYDILRILKLAPDNITSRQPQRVIA